MRGQIKRRFQEMILEVVKDLPLYPSSYQSDTTWIAKELVKRYRDELIKMGIIEYPIETLYVCNRPRCVDEAWQIHDKVLRQLNNLHREGKIAKKIDYGRRGKGRNYTFIRWRRHAKEEIRRGSMRKEDNRQLLGGDAGREGRDFAEQIPRLRAAENEGERED